MKTYLIIAASLLAMSQTYAGDEPDFELTEGKIQATEAIMLREMNKKLQASEVRALQLINLVGKYNNERFSSDIEKGESEEAYSSFIARFQTIREEKNSFAQKEIQLSFQDLRNYTNRYDQLSKDIQKFLNR
jgi:hypothetical protein